MTVLKRRPTNLQETFSFPLSNFHLVGNVDTDAPVISATLILFILQLRNNKQKAASSSKETGGALRGISIARSFAESVPA